MEDVYLEQMKD
jgi:hypothetical protein